MRTGWAVRNTLPVVLYRGAALITLKKIKHMHYTFLDAGGAALLVLVLGAGILFLLLAITIEAIFIQRMGLSAHFGKAMLHSFLANLATVLAGYLLLAVAGDIFYDYIWVSLAFCYVITVLIEAWVLQLLNRTHTIRETFKVSVYMNIATYVILYIMVFLNR